MLIRSVIRNVYKTRRETHIYEPVHEKTNNFGFPTRSDTIRHAQSEQQARSLKFRKKRCCTIFVAKTNLLINCVSTGLYIRDRPIHRLLSITQRTILETCLQDFQPGSTLKMA